MPTLLHTPMSRKTGMIRRPGDAFSTVEVPSISLLQVLRQKVPPQALSKDHA